MVSAVRCLLVGAPQGANRGVLICAYIVAAASDRFFRRRIRACRRSYIHHRGIAMSACMNGTEPRAAPL